MSNKSIQIEEIQPGTNTVAYAISGTQITFRDEIMFDLSRYERDHEVHIDLCESRDNILIVGMSDYYVAQLVIAGRQYEEIASPAPELSPDDGGEDGDNPGMNEPQIELRPLPFDISRCKLILWPLSDTYKEVHAND